MSESRNKINDLLGKGKPTNVTKQTPAAKTADKLGKLALWDSSKDSINAIDSGIRANHHIKEIPLGLIAPNPDQPRKTLAQETLNQLANSMQAQGLLQPIVVRQDAEDKNKFILIAGQRRLAAAKQLAWPAITALVQEEVSEENALARALIENLQRDDIPPLELGRMYKRLRDEYNYSEGEIAELVHKSRPTVSNFIAILEHPEVAEAVERGLAPSKAADIARIKDKTLREEKISQALNNPSLTREEIRGTGQYTPGSSTLPLQTRLEKQENLNRASSVTVNKIIAQVSVITQYLQQLEVADIKTNPEGQRLRKSLEALHAEIDEEFHRLGLEDYAD